MKKFITILLTLALIFGLCACGGASGGKDGLKVGFGRASILPDDSVALGGGDASARQSDGYLDPIYATCIALTEGDQTILLYTLDLITVTLKTYEAQTRISQETGIPEDNIILNCTHTHSAPSLGSGVSGTYLEKFFQACTDAAIQAIDDQAPASIYYGVSETENVNFIRHYYTSDGGIVGVHQGSISEAAEHEYDANEDVQVIKFTRDTEGKKDIVLMNFGTHPHIVSQKQTYAISADWPGAARSYVEENADVYCAVFQSNAGDTTPHTRFVELNGDGYRLNHVGTGTSVGEVCVSVLNGEMTKAEGSGINLSIKRYTNASMKEGIDDPELMSQASNIAALRQQYGSSHILVSQAVAASDLDTHYEANGLVSRQNYPESFTMSLHTLAVDGISFIFAPFEMFTSTGEYIKENSPYDMTFLVSCSETPEGHMGYIPDENGCEKNYYEYDVTKWARGTAEDVAKAYVEMLTETKNAG